ncbi:MAG: PAS domain-containing protein, partial [Cytophagales bacterium]|nr:PAS domain-containing protein [Rhizobacter sp.]
MTIRARIQVLVVACIVPAWLLAVGVSYLSYVRERDAMVSATVQTARSLTQSVERELATSIAVLQTLGTSTRIDEGDYRRFHERAVQTLPYSSGDNILLVDTELRVLVSVADVFGAPLLRLRNDRFPQVMASGQPAVSDFFIGQVSKKPQVAVAVPVMRGGKAVARLEMVFSPERFSQILERQDLPAAWTVAVVDSQGVTVARNRSPENFVGKPVAAVLLNELKQRSGGSFRGRTRDGIDVIGCFSRSEAYGWAVAIGVPEAVFDARLRRTMLLYASGAAVLLVLGLLLASRIGRRIAEPIQALVAPALAIGRGEEATIAVSPVREATDLGQALLHAQHLLHQREQARQQAEASLRDNQSRLRMALDASQIGDWDLDLRTNVMHHSLRHDQCFGYTQPVADWSKERFFEHLHPDDRERVDVYMQGVVRDGRSWQLDCRVVWPDGSVHWLATHGTFLHENGVPYFMLGIVIDMTERKQNEELRVNAVRLEAENRQMHEATRLKSEFLANMSHELRTPLNAVIGFADVLRADTAPLEPTKRNEYLGYIASSGRHLLRLINDVLDLSKVEAGKMDVNPTDVRLTEVKEFVERSFDALGEQKGLGFHVELNADLPATVFTDGGRLQQVLKNLLSNAFKFTQEGEVTLTMRRAEKGRRFLNPALEAATEVIAFAVTDTGIGIPKDKQRLIFEAFQQADGTTNRKFGGTGLGLSISREIARLLGGEIRVESSENQGSTFTLFLPTRYVPRESGPDRGIYDPRDFTSPPRQTSGGGSQAGGGQAGRPPSRNPGPSRDQRRRPAGNALQYTPERRAVPQTVIDDDREHIEEGDRTVLVIENDQNFAKVLLDMARDKGYKGVVELDGEAGLKAAREIRPDAITLDVDMPGMDGLQVLDRLKRDPETRH